MLKYVSLSVINESIKKMTHQGGKFQVDEADRMSVCISELKGITPELIRALRSIGIDNTRQLLAATGQPAERSQIAALLQIEDAVLLELVNCADMTRIHGLSRVNIELLIQAGVDRIVELQRRIPENLHGKLLSIAIHQHLPNLPRLEDVQRWIREAKQLDRAVYY